MLWYRSNLLLSNSQHTCNNHQYTMHSIVVYTCDLNHFIFQELPYFRNDIFYSTCACFCCQPPYVLNEYNMLLNGGVQSSIVNVFMHACTGKGVEGWESPWDDQHLPGYWWTANTLLQWWGGWSLTGEREGPSSGSIAWVCMCVCMRVMQSNYIEYRICFMHYATAHKNTHTYGSDPN